MDQKDYLFVYGTLRRNSGLKLKDRVNHDLEYIGRAKIDGTLYDIGRYPGAVKEKNHNEIIGDVFEVSDASRVFKILDKYEGDEFHREKNRVKLRSGKSVNAWIYWYSEKPVGKLKIRYKDYLNYLKSKKTA